jgi:hypothetical protein
MKTTLDIDDRLLSQAKAAAAKERKSLTRLIEEGLALRLRPASPRRPRQKKISLPVFNGAGGLADGVDPRSNESLFNAADS